ncbi:uncharacterized protein PpBr36_11085 [Pyricularia pennisetigena]|uniref:uncharacterized protein n=1 Tax=Pyricularia pennisetigena TaxID=1578925 RepID=UPI0011521F6A|nr:uncharacterized protein PpBr36_11085 [Pyricularia pennisetigena]TLS20641.1 hypothetical protein PpBr36_11085 [Pyricularia pennisetigena]
MSELDVQRKDLTVWVCDTLYGDEMVALTARDERTKRKIRELAARIQLPVTVLCDALSVEVIVATSATAVKALSRLFGIGAVTWSDFLAQYEEELKKSQVPVSVARNTVKHFNPEFWVSNTKKTKTKTKPGRANGDTYIDASTPNSEVDFADHALATADVDVDLDSEPSQAGPMLRDDLAVLSGADLTIESVERGRRAEPQSFEDSYLNPDDSLFQSVTMRCKSPSRKRKASAISAGFYEYDRSPSVLNDFTHISIDFDGSEAAAPNPEGSLDGDAQSTIQGGRESTTHINGVDDTHEDLGTRAHSTMVAQNAQGSVQTQQLLPNNNPPQRSVSTLEQLLLDRARFEKEQWLNDNVIMTFIQRLASPRIGVLDSLSTRTPIDPASLLTKDMLLQPINTGDHWILSRYCCQNEEIKLYNSRNSSPLEAAWDQAHKALGSLTGKKPLRHSCATCPQQQNDFDCGVFTIIVARYLAAGKQVPDTILDAAAWRTFLQQSLLTSDQAALSLHLHRYVQQNSSLENRRITLRFHVMKIRGLLLLAQLPPRPSFGLACLDNPLLTQTPDSANAAIAAENILFGLIVTCTQIASLHAEHVEILSEAVKEQNLLKGFAHGRVVGDQT